ncbi:MAG: hypothetical protein QXO27_03540 [Candidatus Aenigmatarchaeota archaeon]
MKKSKISTQTKIILLIILVILLSTIFFTRFFISILLISLTFLLSYILNTLELRFVGLELVTFTTVIFGYVYGPWMGGVFGLVLVVIHFIITQSFGGYMVWVIPEYIAAGVVASIFTSTSITMIGVAIISVIVLMNILFTTVFYYSNLPKYIFFAVTNLAFNIFLFLMFGETVIKLLT